MENRERVQTGFDERAALAELERLRHEIERYRAKRKAVSEEFDAFVRSFKSPPADAVPRPRPQSEPPEARLPDTRRPDTRVADTLPARREDETVVPLAAAAAPTAARRGPSKTPALLAGALTLLAVGGWVTWKVTRAPRDTTAAPQPDTRPAAPSIPPTAIDAASRPDPSASELTTTKPVWVRVTADGQRVVERELPANARIPLTATKTIVIRAGNAGAVRVTLAGQDQGLLGPEGTVVTRTFSVPPTPPRQ
jgi:hypothetical protein